MQIVCISVKSYSVTLQKKTNTMSLRLVIAFHRLFFVRRHFIWIVYTGGNTVNQWNRKNSNCCVESWRISCRATRTRIPIWPRHIYIDWRKWPHLYSWTTSTKWIRGSSYWRWRRIRQRWRIGNNYFVVINFFDVFSSLYFLKFPF